MIGYCSTATAQFSIGAKAGVAMPVGSFGQGYNMGFGGIANAAYAIKENMSIGFNAGFYAFKGTDFPASTEPSARIIPIFADFKYFFDTEGFMPYVSTGLGVYLHSSSYTSLAIPALVVGGETRTEEIPSEKVSATKAKFGVSPTIGFLVGNKLKYGASVRYNILFSDASYIDISFGVSYPLGQ